MCEWFTNRYVTVHLGVSGWVVSAHGHVQIEHQQEVPKCGMDGELISVSHCANGYDWTCSGIEFVEQVSTVLLLVILYLLEQ